MKSCFYQYRKGLYERLSTVTHNGESIPVWQYPPKDVEMPFILIGDMNALPVGVDDKDAFMQELSVEIHVVNEGATTLTVDEIMNDIMDKLITMGVTTVDRDKFIEMDGFENSSCLLQSQTHITEFEGDRIIVRNVLVINAIIDEL